MKKIIGILSICLISNVYANPPAKKPIVKESYMAQSKRRVDECTTPKHKEFFAKNKISLISQSTDPAVLKDRDRIFEGYRKIYEQIKPCLHKPV